MTSQPNPFASHWLIRDIVLGQHIAAAGPGGMLFIGDSIVEGFYGSALAGRPLVNAGYSGIWIEALSLRAPRLAALAQPRAVALLVGTNDAKRGRPPAELKAVAHQYRVVASSLAAQGRPLVLVSPPPVEAGKRLTGHYSPEAMAEIARGVEAAAGDLGARFFDLHGALLGPDGFAKADTTTDGVHLAPGAYDTLREGLERSLAS